MLKRITLILLLLIANNLAGQIPPNLVMESETRLINTLSGNWQRIAEGGTSEVNLPYAEYDAGEVKYLKNIKLPNNFKSDRQLHLYFLGISSDIEISINDNFLGKYVGGMTPFLVKIPQNSIDGYESLKIEMTILPPTDNILRIRTKSIDIKKNHYGLLRDFYLVSTSKVWLDFFDLSMIESNGNEYFKTNLKISSFQINEKISGQDSITGLLQEGNTINLKAEIYDQGTLLADRMLDFKLEKDRVLDTNIFIDAVNLERWSPTNPKNYTIKYSLLVNDNVLDDITILSGIKNSKIANQKLLLNNDEIKINAVSYIEYYEGSPILTKETFETDIDRISKLGANAIRFKYSPPHPYMGDLCNKYGLLLLIDLPAYQIPSDLLLSKQVSVRLNNIERRFKNFYGRYVSNYAYGFPSTSNISESGDKSSYLNYKFFTESDAYTNSNADFVILDVPKEIDDAFLDKTNQKIKKPVIFSYGSMVQIKNNNGYSDKLSLDYQAYLLKTHYKLKTSNKAGDVLETYNDYELENPTLKTNNEDNYLATFGLVTSARNERISYQTARTLFKSEKEPLLNAGTEGGDSNILFLVIGIILTIIFVFLFNRLRRFREYIIRALFRPFNFYSDIRDQRIISSFQTFILSIIVSFSFGIFVASILYVGKSYNSMEYLGLILLPSKSLREVLYSFIWIPEALMMILSVIFFIKIYLISIILKVLSFGVRSRIFLNDTITISVWSILPLVLLLPLGILGGRLIEQNDILLPVFILIAFILIVWSVNRILKSTSVVFDVRGWKVYSIGLLSIIVIIMIPLIFLQINDSVISYLQFFYKVYLS